MAFEIKLSDNSADVGTDKAATESNSIPDGDSSQTKPPRKLPKLSSLSQKSFHSKQLDEDALSDKLRKAEENRTQVLESKKQKARKFVTKHEQKSDQDTAEGSTSENAIDDDQNALVVKDQ